MWDLSNMNLQDVGPMKNGDTVTYMINGEDINKQPTWRISRVNIAGPEMRKAICPMFVCCTNERCEYKSPKVTCTRAVICHSWASPLMSYNPEELSAEYYSGKFEDSPDYFELVDVEEQIHG